MTRRFYPSDDQVDDFAQVDGDVAFAPGSAGQPWVRAGVPPWHMWGNSQVIGPVVAETTDTTAPQLTGQLVKVAYKRPDTWHWVFAARIIDAPVPGVAGEAEIEVFFDVIVGVGRAQVKLEAFERFRWQWLGLDQPPRQTMWTSSALTPALDYIIVGPVSEPDPLTKRRVDQIVAQDVQVSCRVRFFNDTGLGTATVEVSGFMAPKTHVRADWFSDGPAEMQFGGGEIGGT